MLPNLRSNSFKAVVLGAIVSWMMTSGAVGCATAAVGAAGAAGGIVYTDRGAKGDAKGDVQKVTQQTRDAFKEMGIRVTETESKESGKEQSLNGKTGEKDVSVKVTPAAQGTSRVEVTVSTGPLQWDKDYAKEVLSQIVNQG